MYFTVGRFRGSPRPSDTPSGTLLLWFSGRSPGVSDLFMFRFHIFPVLSRKRSLKPHSQEGGEMEELFPVLSCKRSLKPLSQEGSEREELWRCSPFVDWKSHPTRKIFRGGRMTFKEITLLLL